MDGQLDRHIDSDECVCSCLIIYLLHWVDKSGKRKKCHVTVSQICDYFIFDIIIMDFSTIHMNV